MKNKKNKSKKSSSKKIGGRAGKFLKSLHAFMLGHRPGVMIIAVAAFLSMIFVVWFLGFYSRLDKEVSFVVDHGATVSSVARELKDTGLIKSEDEFKVLVAGFGGNVKRGVYDIPARSGTWRIAKMIARGEVASTIIMIPEGLTIKQIVEILDNNPFLSGKSCAGSCPLDGELFPDTYKVAKGDSRESVISTMKKKMLEIERVWITNGRSRPAPLKNWNEVVTLASIVQRETPKKAEMPTVASLYLNRLRKGMRLQADPTVVYAITDGFGDMQGRALYTGHLKTAHPHNTYVNHGLPPHPIANVGRDAIRAVLDPANTNYLFMVADGTGGHVFSRTYEEHKIKHAEWREIKKSRE